MEFGVAQAALAGLAATAVMTVLMAMAPMMKVRMDMPMMLGTMMVDPGSTARLIGYMVHFMMGVLFGIIYAALVSAFDIETSVAGWGALIGVVHGVAAGVMMSMMGMMHPRMRAATPSGAQVEAPGVFGMRYGAMTPIAIIGLHAVFGAVWGAVYAA